MISLTTTSEKALNTQETSGKLIKKDPLVIQSPYISHQYYLKYLQPSDLLDHWIQKKLWMLQRFVET